MHNLLTIWYTVYVSEWNVDWCSTDWVSRIYESVILKIFVVFANGAVNTNINILSM